MQINVDNKLHNVHTCILLWFSLQHIFLLPNLQYVSHDLYWSNFRLSSAWIKSFLSCIKCSTLKSFIIIVSKHINTKQTYKYQHKYDTKSYKIQVNMMIWRMQFLLNIYNISHSPLESIVYQVDTIYYSDHWPILSRCHHDPFVNYLTSLFCVSISMMNFRQPSQLYIWYCWLTSEQW